MTTGETREKEQDLDWLIATQREPGSERVCAPETLRTPRRFGHDLSGLRGDWKLERDSNRGPFPGLPGEHPSVFERRHPISMATQERPEKTRMLPG